jgi:FkbM family methyltransferase
MKRIDGSEILLELKSDEAKSHFNDPNNYSAFIIQEWEDLPYSKYIKHGSVILDIGANVGLFALHVQPYAKRLICVEPTPEHMRIQKELISVEHEQAALNSYTGKARFRREPVNTTMNTLRDAPDSFEVDCITLLDLCKKYQVDKVDFCKIDIEGSEWEALTEERIKEVSGIIDSFFVELHPRSLESQSVMSKRFAGYKIEMIDYNGSIYCYK